MTTGSSIARAPRPSSLADVLDLILDKGLVIDAYVRISAVGIELLTIDARIVIASVDTYLHYAEAVNRLDLSQTETKGLTGLFGGDDSSEDQPSNGQASNGRSTHGRSKSEQPQPRAVTSGRSGGSSQRPRSSDRQEGEGRDQGGQNDRDDEDEGRGKSLARRLGDKGRWNS
jgi:hypothetical protein